MTFLHLSVPFFSSASQTVNTSQMYLDISSYSRDVGDDYFVSVTAHDGQEKSESVFIRFTYSKDLFNVNTHKYECKFSEYNLIIWIQYYLLCMQGTVDDETLLIFQRIF